MGDITKCLGDNCPIKESCYRYTSEADEWQSYSNFYDKETKNCEYKIENDKKKS